MDWRENYRSKLTTADDAVKHIKPGDKVVVTHAAGEPTVLTDAMVRNYELYKDVSVIHMVAMGKAEYCKPELTGHFRHISLFVGGATRTAVAEGRGDFIPVFFSEIPDLLRNTIKPNVVLLHLSPPDAHGYCSYGISVDYTKPAAEDCGALLIAQINKNMPRTHGDSFIHVSRLNHIVEDDTPIIELKPAEISAVEKAIGENCAKLINSGDTLQLGIGGLPDALMMSLGDKCDLGVHTEMFSDGAAKLMISGVINNKHKTLHRGKSVASFLMGTRVLYDYADDNPEVAMYPVDYVNDPRVISKIDNMVSINSCVEVDLMGQVAATSIGLKQISGVGGQVDFVRGANWSRNGRTIIAFASSLSGGKASKIVKFLAQGAEVTTSRNDVNYIVTEYGIAQLKGQTLRERARRLIDIAHPNFREDLKAEFKLRFKETF